MKFLRSKKFIFAAIFSVLTIAGLGFATQKAYAALSSCSGTGAYWGRKLNCTFYRNLNTTNKVFPWDGNTSNYGLIWNWQSGYTSVGADNTARANHFINFMQTGLNRCGTGASVGLNDCPGPTQVNRIIQYANVVGNSFMINTMLGKNGPDFANEAAGIAYAQNNFNSWANRVRDYATAGRIDWDVNLSAASLANCASGTGRTDTLVAYSPLQAIDETVYCNTGDDNQDYLRFRNPNGTFYRINLQCGNVTGTTNPLQNLNGFANTPSAEASHASNVSTDENPSIINFTSRVTTEVDGSFEQVDNVDIIPQFYIEYLDGRPTVFLNLSGGATVTTTSQGLRQNDVDLNETTNVGGDPYDFVLNRNGINVTSFGLTAGDKICARTVVEPYTGQVDSAGNVIAGSITDPNQASAPHCITVADYPYVKFFGNDVFAGGGFEGEGGCNTGGRIFGWSNNASHAGSSAQYGVTATYNASPLLSIWRFTSANNGNAGLAVPPVGLSFSNVQGVTPGFYLGPAAYARGGGFGGTNCFKNYWSNAPSTFTVDADNEVNITTLGSGVHGIRPNGSGPLWLDDGSAQTMNINQNQHTVLYVDGDVYIEDNITFVGCIIAGTCPTEGQLPSFTLVVRGDVFIAGEVNTLEGIYVSQKRSATAGGTIYTCAGSSGPFDKDAEPEHFLPGGTCDNKLVVIGTFITQKAKLLRTANSVRDSVPDENPVLYSLTNDLDYLTAAETFIFSPELYVTSLAACADVAFTCQPGPYDSITSLPPIL